MAGSNGKETQGLVRVMAALSDENRFRIVAYLASASAEVSCGNIGKALGLSPSLLSHHLSILEDAGVIERRRNGLWTMNGLRRSALAEHISSLQALVGPDGTKSAPPG